MVPLENREFLSNLDWAKVAAIVQILSFFLTLMVFFLNAIGLREKQILAFSIASFLVIIVSSAYFFTYLISYYTLFVGIEVSIKQLLSEKMVTTSIFIGSIVGSFSSLSFVLPVLKADSSLKHVFEKVIVSYIFGILIETVILFVFFSAEYVEYCFKMLSVLDRLLILVLHPLMVKIAGMCMALIFTSTGGFALHLGAYVFIAWAIE